MHGRNSGEDQPNSPKRTRIILTRHVAALAPDPDKSQGDAVESGRRHRSKQAAEAAGVRSGTVAIIGGPAVFGMFMDRYDTFWLSQAPKVKIPGGEGCFPGVPERTPQQILSSHGLKAGRAAAARPGRGRQRHAVAARRLKRCRNYTSP